MTTTASTRSAQLRNQLGWFSEDNKHSIKLTTELRRDDYTQDLTTNQLGSFAFNSLADLDAGRPSSFARQLSPRTRSTSAYIGSVALGDAFRPTDNLQVQYGLRVDGNHFNAGPNENTAVEQKLGVRNDHIPNNLYLARARVLGRRNGAAGRGLQGAVRGRGR